MDKYSESELFELIINLIQDGKSEIEIIEQVDKIFQTHEIIHEGMSPLIPAFKEQMHGLAVLLLANGCDPHRNVFKSKNTLDLMVAKWVKDAIVITKLFSGKEPKNSPIWNHHKSKVAPIFKEIDDGLYTN